MLKNLFYFFIGLLYLIGVGLFILLFSYVFILHPEIVFITVATFVFACLSAFIFWAIMDTGRNVCSWYECNIHRWMVNYYPGSLRHMLGLKQRGTK